MGISYRIISENDLVYVYLHGDVSFDEIAIAFVELIQQDQYHPGIRYLVDGCDAITVERDHARMMVLKTLLATEFETQSEPSGGQTLAVLYAPNDPGRTLSRVIARTWPQTQRARLVIVDRAEQAQDLLELGNCRLQDLRDRVL